MSLNKAILLGNVGKDPEIRDAGGNKVATFGLATSETWKDKDGNKQEQTDWHNIVVWGEKPCAVIAQYVKKGSKLLIEGKIRTRKYTDKDNNERYVTEIICDNFKLEGDANRQASNTGGGDPGPSGGAKAASVDDLDF